MNQAYMVGFWSPYHGQTGQTCSIAAIGTYIGITYKIKTLIMHSQFSKSNLENAFLYARSTNDIFNFDDTGIDSLQRLAKTKQLCSENFTDYTKTLISERLELLTGTTKANEDIYDQIAEQIQYILLCSKQCYHLVLCDIGSGNKNTITNKTLEQTDLIVVNLNQNIEVLKSFFEKREYHDILNRKESILLLGNYEPSSKYTASYIKRLFDYRGEIYTVPRNTAFMDAYNDHAVLEYFFSNYDVKKNDSNFSFMEEVRKASSKIMEHTNLDIEMLNRRVESLSFRSFLKGFLKGG